MNFLAIVLHDLGEFWGYPCQPFQFCKLIDFVFRFLWKALVLFLLPTLLGNPKANPGLMPHSFHLTLVKCGHSTANPAALTWRK